MEPSFCKPPSLVLPLDLAWINTNSVDCLRVEQSERVAKGKGI